MCIDYIVHILLVQHLLLLQVPMGITALVVDYIIHAQPPPDYYQYLSLLLLLTIISYYYIILYYYCYCYTLYYHIISSIISIYYILISIISTMALTQAQAQHRFNCILPQSITYSLHLHLQPNYYTGLSEIQFTLTNISSQLFIDCSSKNITKYIINGHPIKQYKHAHSFLYLDQSKLKVGVNHVCVQYQNNYDTDERGLMSFVDVDAKQYLYTTLEAYFAHRVFAVFDQPDLKAIMNLSVTCPSHWNRILSNESPVFDQQFDEQKYLSTAPTWHKDTLAQYIKDNKQSRMAVFPPTKLMPTYLFCVMAGPYEQIQLKQRYNNIPMSLYASATNFPYVQKMAPYLFETTVQSMRFFEQFFGVPYAFSKYDQIFVHQMESCAMENTGMVTYHDAQYIWYDQVTQQKALDLADTMAHQLAHHWFGNLTTMKWWDDLWLNQSFAQFIAYYALEVIQDRFKIVKYQSSMAQFLVKKSQRGYADDKSFTTHPIRGVVENTAVAQSIFDGITYAKGAATLKQLLLLMGEANFSAALKYYFTKYAYKNTTLKDFIDCLQTQFDNQYGITLQQWQKLWLETSSLNQLQPIWWKSHTNQEGEKQKILKIVQRPYTEKYPTLRPHKIKIAFFKENCEYDVVQVFIPAKPEINIPIDPEHAATYKAIMLNYEDHTFAKVIFDKQSQNFFIKNLLKIKHTLTRTYIWRNFFDMVVDAVIPSTKYIDLFIANIGEQTSDTIVQRNYESAIECVSLYTPQQYRQQLYIRLFYFTLRNLERTSADSKNRSVTLKFNLIELAQSELATRVLYKWYQGQYPSLVHHELSIANKWRIVGKVFGLKSVSREQKLKLLSAQLQCDKSEAANLQKLRCQAIISNKEQFQKWYTSLQDPSSTMTVNTKKYLIEGLTDGYNKQKMSKYKSRYFKDIPACVKVLDFEHLRHFIVTFQPTDDNLQETVDGLKLVEIKDQKLSKAKYRMEKLIDRLQKRLKAYEKFRNDL